MKRFYIIFLALCVLFAATMVLNVWGVIGIALACMMLVAYRFYQGRLRLLEARNEGLETQLEQLHTQLDQSIYKQERASREAEQVKQAKRDLLAIMSHEIRTPMNGVLGTLTLLSETALNPEQNEYASTIRSCGESLLATVNDILVNDLLQVAKADQDAKPLVSKDFDLRNALEEVLDMFGVRAAEEGLDLIYDIDEDVPEQLVGDAVRLRQVLTNLLDNAVKFTLQGEIFVGVHRAKTIHPSGTMMDLSFEVRDTGSGMSPEQLRQLFNGIPGAPSKKEGEGEPVETGLGLVVCRRLVELMGGRIVANSHPGEGSVFIFDIPMSPSQKGRHQHAIKDQLSVLEGKRILIVDDNPTQRAVLLRQLASWKILPASAGSAHEALEMLGGHTAYDLILTDMHIADTNGLQLARTLKGRFPSIPLILMNPAGDEHYQQESVLFFSVLNKPIRQHLLRDHLVNALRHGSLGTQGQTPDSQMTLEKMSEEFAKQYPLHILIAEDNPINQKIAIKMLGKLGYQPALARNGKEVLDMVSHEHYDLILMDVQMPEMDGFEATRMLRLCLEVQPVIIAMTANVMQGDRDDCMQSGMDDYISKPIEIQALMAQLAKWGQVINDKKRIAS